MAEETKITIRMSPSEIQDLEDYMADHDIGNRSDFVRAAIEHYMAFLDAPEVTEVAGDGVFVHLTEMQLDILTRIAMDGTLATSVEEFIRTCVLERIMPQDVKDDIIRRALMNAQDAAKYR